MKITKERLKEIIKEEIEVTLTNEEAAEMFGDEVLEELDEQIENVFDPQNWVLVSQSLEKILMELALPTGAIAFILNALSKKLGLDAVAPVRDPSVLDHPDSGPEM